MVLMEKYGKSAFMDGGLGMDHTSKAHWIDTDISVIMSTGLDLRFGCHHPVLAMAAPSHGVGRGNFKLKIRR